MGHSEEVACEFVMQHMFVVSVHASACVTGALAVQVELWCCWPLLSRPSWLS